VPESQEHHQGVPVTIPIRLGLLDQPLDLIDGQVLPGPKLAIFGAVQRDCSILLLV
jgi:hypothetical protein